MKHIFTLILWSACSFAFGQIIYVNDATGSDSNDGFSMASPKKHIGGASGGISALTEGQILSVAAGHYDEYVIIDKDLQLVKTGDSPVTINGVTFIYGSKLLGNHPADGAFRASQATVSEGSSIGDALLLLAQNGALYVNGGSYQETVTLSKSFLFVPIENPVISSLTIEGPGIEVTLGGDLSISGSLNVNRLNGGILELSAFDLTVLSSGTITSGSAGSYVRTSGTGSLIMEEIGSSAVVFPVGTFNAYTPVMIDDESDTGEEISVRVHRATNPLAFTVALPGTVNSFIGLEWIITESETGGNNAMIRFDYNGESPESDFQAWENAANRVVSSSNGTSWTNGTDISINNGYSTAHFSSLGGSFVIYSDFPNAIEGSEQSSISVYPNPFHDQASVMLNITKEGNLSISLSDLSGRVLSNRSLPVLPGKTIIEVNETGVLPAGVYFVTVAGSDGASVKRIIKN